MLLMGKTERWRDQHCDYRSTQPTASAAYSPTTPRSETGKDTYTTSSGYRAGEMWPRDPSGDCIASSKPNPKIMSEYDAAEERLLPDHCGQLSSMQPPIHYVLQEPSHLQRSPHVVLLPKCFALKHKHRIEHNGDPGKETAKEIDATS